MISYYLHDRNLDETSAVFRISGPDANTFLNGQFTQELRVSPGQFAYGLWLNQKGKVLGDSHVLRFSTDEHLIFSPRWSAPELRQRLEDYLIADEVTVADESGDWQALTCWGDEAMAALQSIGFASPSAPVVNAWLRTQNAFAWGTRHASTESYLLLVRAAACESLCAQLRDQGAAPATRETFESARIAAGIPAVPDDIGPGDLPNEGGLDAVAISYTKGCYLGQEVMSRLKNLGQVRRRLFVVRGPGGIPTPRSPLFQAGQRVGELRSTAPDGDGFIAFAMLSLMQLDRARGLSLRADGAEELSCSDHG